MLKVSPNERLGFGASGITQVKAHAYFSKHVDFDALLRKEVPGPLRVEDSDSLPKEIRREGNTGQLLPRRKTWSEGSDANPQLQPPSLRYRQRRSRGAAATVVSLSPLSTTTRRLPLPPPP